MQATIFEERRLAELNSQEDMLAVFRGRNLMRFLIAAWPKITQLLVGLTVFNTYAVYFCTQPSKLTHDFLIANMLQFNTPETRTRFW